MLNQHPARRAAAIIILCVGCAGPSRPTFYTPGRLFKPSQAKIPLPKKTLDLTEALTHAFARSPEIRAAQARWDEARGRVTEAGTYPHNPTLEAGVGSRRAAGDSVLDFELALEQTIEIAGQRGNRLSTAKGELAAESAYLLRRMRLIAARVHLSFIGALEAKSLTAIADKDAALTRDLHELAQRRLDRGAGSQLDVNVAAAEFARAEARAKAAQADYAVSRAQLAETIGLDATFMPIPNGSLRVSLNAPPALEAVIRDARAHRADLQALHEMVRASRAQVSLARSEGWPSVTIRGFAAREDGTDTIVGGGLSIPIPLFNRNQGRIEQSRAARKRARAEQEIGNLTVTREVVASHAVYQASVATSQRLRDLVLGNLEESIKLLQRSFDAGKARWPEVVVIRRSLVDGQRELTMANAQARRAWIQLQVASGKMPIPRTAGKSEQDL